MGEGDFDGAWSSFEGQERGVCQRVQDVDERLDRFSEKRFQVVSGSFFYIRLQQADHEDRCDDNTSSLAYLIDQSKVKESQSVVEVETMDVS